MSDDTERRSDPRDGLKPYEKPKLTAYGDVREITRAGGTKAMPDGAPGGLNMIKS